MADQQKITFEDFKEQVVNKYNEQNTLPQKEKNEYEVRDFENAGNSPIPSKTWEDLTVKFNNKEINNENSFKDVILDPKFTAASISVLVKPSNELDKNFTNITVNLTKSSDDVVAAEGEEEGSLTPAEEGEQGSATPTEAPSASTTSQNPVINFLNDKWPASQTGDDPKPSYEQFISNTITKIDKTPRSDELNSILEALGGVSCNLWNYKLENGNIVYKPDVYKPDVQGGGASDYAPSEISMLGGDPLFLVLSEFFMSSKRGNSLADILEKINDNLEKLAKKM